MRKAYLLSFCLITGPLWAQAPSQSPRATAISSMKFREIGPAVMGGRVDAIAVVEKNPKVAYVGLAGGGVWKTVNAFTTWEPIFDKQPVASVGALAVAPSDPNIVWVGTGEANNRQSSSWGNGVYKSSDAGKTWQHMGLDDSQHIGRIVIDPKDANIVYVAAGGHLWGPNHQRGVFKTTDGGKTWTNSLFVSDNTGATDIAMDPQTPETLYAAMYERQRTVGGYNGGGPESALYKSTDAGAHWTRLTQGIPAGDLGRISIAVYRKNPNVVYATIEHAEGGVFRSDDKGATWTKMGATNPRPSYFSQIRVDPNDDQRVWLGGTSLMQSTDGGKTFRNSTLSTSNGVRGSMHEDFHDQWIDPADSSHMISGNDGGIYTTWDGGTHWELHNNAAIGQFYTVSYDFSKPYRICGGLQDNDSWCGPSNSLVIRGSSNDEWLKVGGGDGMYSQIDPKDPNTVYTEGQEGSLARRDLASEESKSLRVPEPPDATSPNRFQWTTPFILSNFDSRTLYIGANAVFKSTDRGDSWTRISPDLTTGADRNKMPILGRLPDKTWLSRNDGATNFPEATTIAESPMHPGILWAGTEDGNLQVTRDGGKTWTNVAGKISGLPKGTYVSRIVPSKYAEGTAYAAFDGHRGNDFTPYLFTTSDFGAHWTDISNGLPRNTGTVHVVIEHFRNQNLLLAGTEMGLFVSFNRGKNWEELKNNLPRVPVFDLKIQPRENDLIVATHGRSIWVLDDITPLEELTDPVMSSDAHLFAARTGVEWHMMDAKSAIAHAFYISDNPPTGGIIDYYLKAKAAGDATPKIEILDSAGKLVRTLSEVPGEAGVNRTTWDLRTDAPTPIAAGGRRGGGGGGGGGRGGGGRGILVPPGEYTVRLSVGATQMTTKMQVEDDARVNISAADRALRTQTLTELFSMSKETGPLQAQFNGLRASIAARRASWARPGAPAVPDAAKAAVNALEQKMNAIERPAIASDPFAAGTPLAKYNAPAPPERVAPLMTAIDGYAFRPNDDQIKEFKELQAELPALTAKLKQLVEVDLPEANKVLEAEKLPVLTTTEQAPGGRRGEPPQDDDNN